MKEKFIGVMGERAYLLEAVRGAFSKGRFDICHLHHLPNYDRATFAEWASDLHCNKESDIGSGMWRKLQLYVVNYILCPEATDEFEVEAYVREVWPEREECATDKQIFSVGKFVLIKRSRS